MATSITDTQLQELLNEGLSQNEIARRTGIPRSTLRRRLQDLSTPSVHTSIHQATDNGVQEVHQSTHLPDEIITAWSEVQEMLEWWRTRKRALVTEADTDQETERKTYHVQKRYIEAIERASDLEHVSITEIVNRAFKQFFDGGT
jgi:transcriptional regulator with XRE-family HTH domain